MNSCTRFYNMSSANVRQLATSFLIDYGSISAICQHTVILTVFLVFINSTKPFFSRNWKRRRLKQCSRPFYSAKGRMTAVTGVRIHDPWLKTDALLKSPSWWWTWCMYNVAYFVHFVIDKRSVDDEHEPSVPQTPEVSPRKKSSRRKRQTQTEPCAVVEIDVYLDYTMWEL